MPIDCLPEPLRTPAERLRAFLLADSAVMIIVGIAMIARGVGLLPPPGRDIHPWENLISPDAWMVAWILLGVASIAAAPWHSSRVASLLLVADVMLLSFWGATFILAGPDELFSRGAIYLGWSVTIVWAIWRGKRGETLIRKV